MLVVASENGKMGIASAIEVLRWGGSALDAAEAGCRDVEADPNDHSVGVGGYPNLLGQVELDASIMEGTGRRAGAVAALQGYPHPVSIARAILEHLPQHVLLSGDGAARFARERGFEAADPLTDEAREAWIRFRDSGAALAPLHEEIDALARKVRAAGTVNFLVRDAAGRIATAVSTAGWAFKYPGRLGDSPLIGAGNYCDDRRGGCACTGIGEWSIRAGLARQLVLRLEMGSTLGESASATMADLKDIPLPDGITPMMNFIAYDARTGDFDGFTTLPGTKHVWQHVDMAAYETTLSTVL